MLYVMDISEHCGHSIEEQVCLFNNIKPLFVNKPLVVALNKIDIVGPGDLGVSAKAQLDRLKEGGVPLVPMSTVTEEGVNEVKTQCCELLLAQRVEVKLKGKKMPDVLNRLHVAVPIPRDGMERQPFIPSSVKARKSTAAGGGEAAYKKKLEREIELEQGDDYFLDLRKNYLLEDDGHKYDVVPEIIEGKNVADFIDPDILKRLEELEKEEELLEAAGVYDSEPEDEEVLETREKAEKIRRARSLMRKKSIAKRSMNYPVMPRHAAARSRSRARQAEEKMETAECNGDGADPMDDEGEALLLACLLACFLSFLLLAFCLECQNNNAFPVRKYYNFVSNVLAKLH